MLFEFVAAAVLLGSLLYLSQAVQQTKTIPDLEVDMANTPLDIKDLIDDSSRYIQADVEPPEAGSMTPQQIINWQLSMLRPDYERKNPAGYTKGDKPDSFYTNEYSHYDFIEKDV
jgi:hypothetical protein